MKSSIVFSLLTASVLSLATLTLSGQEVSKKEALAAELLDQLHMQKMMDSAFEAMPKMQEQMMASQKLPPEQMAKFHKRMASSMEATKKALGREMIKPIFVKIYADNFDAADLEGLIAFYKTPVGQKFIEKQPQLQAATMQAMGQIMPKIQAAIMESMKESDEDAPADTKSAP